VRPERAADHSPPSSAAVMEEYPPSGPHRACNGITLPLLNIYTVKLETLLEDKVFSFDNNLFCKN